MSSQGHVDGTLTVLWAGWSRVGFLARARSFPVFQNVQTRFGAHPGLCWMCTRCLFTGAHGSCWLLKLHLVLHLIMTGTVPLLCLCAFMVWPGTTMFTCFSISSKVYKICFIQVSCEFVCCKSFVQLVRGIVNAVVKLVAFGAIYNYTCTISKENWTLNW
jgi:hypothetical protein